MNKIKYLLLISIILIFSGCSVDYKIDIDSVDPYSCSEKLTINGFDEKFVNMSYNEFANNIYNKVLNEYEMDLSNKNKTIVNKKSCNIYDLSNSKILENYIISSEISDGNINIVFDEEELGNLIRINNGETVMKTGLSLNFVINVPYQVISTNAKKSNGSNYIWNFDDESKIANIILKYDSTKSVTRFTNEQLIIASVGLLVSLIIIVVIIVLIRHKAVNK